MTHKSTRPLRKGRGRGEWVGIVRLPVQACTHAQRGGCGGFGSEGAPCVAVGGRVFRVQKPRAGAPLALPPRPPLLRARKTRSSSPPSLVGKKKKKKRRSLAHRNVGREGSRGPHHTTPRRLVRHSGVLPPRYPLSLSVLYSPLPCPGFDLPRLVLRFLRSRVFWLLRCWAPSRLPNTQKKKKKIVLNHDHHTTQAAAKNLKNRKTRNSQTEISGSFFRGRGRERERDRRRCAPRDSQDGNSGW